MPNLTKDYLEQRIKEIGERQEKDVLEGRDPSCLVERLREIRAKLRAEGKILPPITKLSYYSKNWYRDNPAALKEILS